VATAMPILISALMIRFEHRQSIFLSAAGNDGALKTVAVNLDVSELVDDENGSEKYETVLIIAMPLKNATGSAA